MAAHSFAPFHPQFANRSVSPSNRAYKVWQALKTSEVHKPISAVRHSCTDYDDCDFDSMTQDDIDLRRAHYSSFSHLLIEEMQQFFDNLPVSRRRSVWQEHFQIRGVRPVRSKNYYGGHAPDPLLSGSIRYPDGAQTAMVFYGHNPAVIHAASINDTLGTWAVNTQHCLPKPEILREMVTHSLSLPLSEEWIGNY